MTWVEEILSLDVKAKEKVELLASGLKADGKRIADVIECSKKAKTADKGHCIEAITSMTESNPGIAEPYLDYITGLIADKTPRVKWEASRIIGNVAKSFPEKAAKAMPNLLANAAGEGTVVKWSAAFALTEIAKHNPKTRAKLIPVFEDYAEQEEGGVQKIYLKALKSLQKG
jgi:hypothetical protein